MRNWLSVAAAVAALVGVPDARAQKAPAKEFGADMVLESFGVDGATNRITRFGMPLDVRIGFLNDSPMSIEPRFGVRYVGDNDFSIFEFKPSFNVLYRISNGPGVNQHMGGYVTAGLLMDFTHESSSALGGSSETDAQFGVSVGVGTRVEYVIGALRPEVFFAKRMKSGANPAATTFGVRFGLSLFH